MVIIRGKNHSKQNESVPVLSIHDPLSDMPPLRRYLRMSEMGPFANVFCQQSDFGLWTKWV